MKWSLPALLTLVLWAGSASAQPTAKPPARPKPPASQTARPASGGQSPSFSFSSSRGRLGVNATSMTDELRDFFGAPHGAGVLVQRVTPQTPAAKAGVRVGDVITKVNGKTIEDTGDVVDALAGKKKGESVSLGVIRGRRGLQLSTKLDTDPAEDDGSFEFNIGGLGDLFKGFGQGGTWSKQWSWSWPPNGSSSSGSGSSGGPSFDERLKELQKRMKGLQEQQ